VLISFILKKVQFIPILLALIFVFFDEYVNSNLKNMLYVITALSPFMSILAIFIFYLPFALYGLLLGSQYFTKRYLFGFSLSFFSAAFLYIISLITDIQINIVTLLIAFYLPVLVILFKIFRIHEGFKVLSSIYRIEPKEYLVLIISIFFLFAVTHFMINNENTYVSNGAYVYTKFISVADGIKNFNEIPQYEPRIGQGEQLFLTDTPTFYSGLAFVKLVLQWIQPVLFFNSVTVFIIWLSILGVFLLVYELLSTNAEKDNYYVNIISMIVALSIVLSFTFLHLFESFKQSSTFPHTFLALSMIFSFPKSFSGLIAIILTLMAAFLIHPTMTSGVLLIAGFSFIFMLLHNNLKELIKNSLTFMKNHKIKILFCIIVILLIPYFYLYPGYYYKNYARKYVTVGLKDITTGSYNYIKDFVFNKNNNPLSFKYPDLRRIDDHHFGFFISFFGMLSLILVVISFRKNHFRKTAYFSFAYVAHFLVSSVISLIPPFAPAEYGYRTVLPFFLVMLVACIAAVVSSFRNKIIKIILISAFLGGFLHASYFVKQSVGFIHSEAIISGETFKDEINFFKQLPIDGRIITFGLYSNAVDTAMSVLTDRYFSRYGYTQWDFEDNVYEKLTRLNSFGVVDAIEPLTSNEFANYLRLAGYKYIFLNACSPIGDLVLKKLLPSNAYAIFQNPTKQCSVMLAVNKTNYAEKVDVVNQIDTSVYKNPNGYWHVTFNRYKKIHNFDLEPYLQHTVEKPDRTIPLEFERTKPTEIKIYGEFKENEWVVFKEEYFSRWKAYMNGKQVPLLATNNRMMLIKTLEGDTITLKYDILPAEKMPNIMSLIAMIGLFFIIVLMI